MRKLALILALLGSLATAALADYDPELERQEAARIEAERRAETERQAEMRARKDAAELQAMRGALGKDAEGKSDAEVRRLYAAWLESTQRQAEAAAAAAPAAEAELRRREAETRPERDAAVRELTGKSLEELENMSDEEAEALARELEEKYGSE
jgi:hypothetical protein